MIFRICLILLVSLGLLTGCSNSEPESKSFDIGITAGTLSAGPATIIGKQGDTITIRIVADEVGSVHIHGYDISSPVGPQKTGVIRFVANATGSFSMTLHSSDTVDHDDHVDNDHHDEVKTEIKLGRVEIGPR